MITTGNVFHHFADSFRYLYLLDYIFRPIAYRNAMFFIDNKYYFDVLDRMPNKQPIRLTALAGCENTDDKLIIPLWLFGFLY